MFQEHAKISEKFGRNWLKGGLLTTKRHLVYILGGKFGHGRKCLKTP